LVSCLLQLKWVTSANALIVGNYQQALCHTNDKGSLSSLL